MKHLEEKHKPKANNENRVMCAHCGHLASSEANLAIHMRAHDAAFSRPTSCTYCRKEFPKYVNMVRHRRIAHSEQYSVDKERLMVEEGSLSIGRDNTKYYQKATCDVCGTTLCSRAQLHLHMKARHGTGLPGYGENSRGRKRRAVSPPPKV